jgi:uncharacterized protein (DUF488 family)
VTILLTVGHSNHPIDTFLRTLQAHSVRTLVDVRRFPGSRRHPHFAQGRLSDALNASGIDYRHAASLGGHRLPVSGSRHIGLRVAAFRGYADHMETAEFEQAVADLLRVAEEVRTAVMCAEADWRRCHRRLLSDYVAARGIPVVHLLDDRRREPHVMLPPAVVENGRVAYPPGTLF